MRQWRSLSSLRTTSLISYPSGSGSMPTCSSLLSNTYSLIKNDKYKPNGSNLTPHVLQESPLPPSPWSPPLLTPDNHNGELVRQNLLLQPILEPYVIPPLPNNLLRHTSHILPKPHQKPLPDILLQLTYIGLHNRPHHYLVPPPALLLIWVSGDVISSSWNRVVHGC